MGLATDSDETSSVSQQCLTALVSSVWQHHCTSLGFACGWQPDPLPQHRRTAHTAPHRPHRPVRSRPQESLLTGEEPPPQLRLTSTPASLPPEPHCLAHAGSRTALCDLRAGPPSPPKTVRVHPAPLGADARPRAAPRGAPAARAGSRILAHSPLQPGPGEGGCTDERRALRVC